MRPSARPRPLLVLAVVGCLAAGLSAPAVTSASAADTAAGFADGLGSLVLSGGEAVPAGSNAPDHLIVSGTTTVTLTVTSVLSRPTNGGPIVRPVGETSTFALSVTSRTGQPVLSETSITIPQHQSVGTVTLKLTGAANLVEITATGTGSQSDWSASTDPVDVALKASSSPGSTSFWGTNGATPCVPTSALGNRVCADLVLPSGVTSNVVLSTGLCDAFLTCGADKDLVQVLADLTGVTRTTPAKLILKCDKLACPGGGVPSYNVLFNLDPDSSVPLATRRRAPRRARWTSPT